MNIKGWKRFGNFPDSYTYWNSSLTTELAIGKTWNQRKKKKDWAVGIYYSPHGKYSSKGVKVKSFKHFSTKKQATDYGIKYMKKVK